MMCALRHVAPLLQTTWLGLCDMLWRVYNVWVTDNHCSDCHEWKHDSHMTSLYGISSQVISKCGAVKNGGLAQ